MRRQVLTFSSIGMLLLITAAGADTALRCGDTTYVIEKGFFGGTVKRRSGAAEMPFCVSDDPAVLTKTLSFRDAEIWCVILHHLSPNSRPLAQQLWVLNRLNRKLYMYDYVFADGAWALQQERFETCETATDN
ncbi:hypothetical protein N9Y31_05535 [Alphaproteobacteria bacterium]|nr:hypothetical protein [Alphaproteobacteria bacterium]